MTPLYVALWLAAIVTIFTSRDFLRGVVWIIAIQISGMVSLLAWDFNLPMPFLFASICDALVLLAVFKFGECKWEEKLMFILVLFLFTHVFFTLANVFSIEYDIHVYSWAIYLLNWAAIILIGTASGFKGYGRDYFRMFDRWDHIFGFQRTIKKEEAPK